jgi:predicted HTH domain antitoxin
MCLLSLQVPQFHHELVKRAVKLALDKSEEDQAAMASLLAFLYASEVMTK